MAKVTIGGTDYILPEMNFLAIERAWPFVVEASETLDPMKGPSAALAVFAAAIMEGDTFDKTQFGVSPDVESDYAVHLAITKFFKKKLKGNELANIKPAMFEILNESGLEVTEGEAIAALTAALENRQEEQNLSPETAVDISANSSQLESKEEAGTE